MKLRYIIHGLSRTEFTVAAVVAGRETDAVVPGLILEAVSDDGSMGHSFKIWGENLHEIEKRVSAGDELAVTLELIDKDGSTVAIDAPLPEKTKATKPKK